jgi:hypothetical protein
MLKKIEAIWWAGLGVGVQKAWRGRKLTILPCLVMLEAVCVCVCVCTHVCVYSWGWGGFNLSQLLLLPTWS